MYLVFVLGEHGLMVSVFIREFAEPFHFFHVKEIEIPVLLQEMYFEGKTEYEHFIISVSSWLLAAIKTTEKNLESELTRGR